MSGGGAHTGAARAAALRGGTRQRNVRRRAGGRSAQNVVRGRVLRHAAGRATRDRVLVGCGTARANRSHTPAHHTAARTVQLRTAAARKQEVETSRQVQGITPARTDAQAVIRTSEMPEEACAKQLTCTDGRRFLRRGDARFVVRDASKCLMLLWQTLRPQSR